MKTSAIGLGLASMVIACAAAPVSSPPPPVATSAPAPSGERLTVFISDLHFGPPDPADTSRYSSLDDFRWPAALHAFLGEISREGNGDTDLVILGDLFELWQHPATPCPDRGADFGCTEKEMADVAAPVFLRHHAELVDLWTFAESGSNRLFIVPGNHDATLLSDAIWRQLTASIGRPAARVTRSTDGQWTSADRRIMAEHGHQIGPDVSGFVGWPKILVPAPDGLRFRRPWGELFVQRFFDGVEKTMPIIDNVIPQSYGVALLQKKTGFAGNARDVARFLAFNVFHTSISQLATLGFHPGDAATNDSTHGWDVGTGRALQERLFADSLPADDPFRAGILDAENADWDPVRAELRAIAADPARLPDDGVVDLCDRIAALKKNAPAEPRATCSNKKLFSAIAGFAPNVILTHHLEDLYAANHDIRTFVFGHTHQPVPRTVVKLRSGRQVAVFNDGAFQRLISPAVLDRAAREKAGSGAPDPLALAPDDLPPCYSAVLVRGGNTQKIELLNWKMREDDASGAWVDICDPNCGRIAEACQTPR